MEDKSRLNNDLATNWGGWFSSQSLAEEIGCTLVTVRARARRIANEHHKLNEWIAFRQNDHGTGKLFMCHPDLVALLRASEARDIGDWTIASDLARELKSATHTIINNAELIATTHNKRDLWIEKRKILGGQFVLCYHPDLVSLLKKESDFLRKWLSAAALRKELKATISTIEANALRIAKEHGKEGVWMQKRKFGRGSPATLQYHPELIDLLRKETVPDVGNWQTAASLEREQKVKLSRSRIHAKAESIAKEHGKLDDWIQKRKAGGTITLSYHPKLVQLLKKEAIPDIGDWYSEWSLYKEFKFDRDVIHAKAESIAKEHGKLDDWIQKRKVWNHDSVCYHPNLYDLLSIYFKANSNLRNRYEIEKNTLDKKLVSFVENVFNESDEVSKDFKKMISIFGASRAIDLLYKFRPEFRGISVERVKSCLVEYLGDFLSAKHEFYLKDLGEAKKFLSEATFREGLFETMKSHCLQYYFQERKKGVEGDSYKIIYGYLVHIIDELGDDTNEFLDQVIEDVVTYFASAIRDFHKPEKFVDHLATDREFPDLNQKINMKELQDKKRMLIADEMGLGKSASVIMAKEHMKLGCAVVVVPSVVVHTWLDYLSDDPERRGYFKRGQAPKVLVVEDPEQLRGITKNQYDYIIVSHGRLNGRYASLLEQLDPDMLIVDEVHELKNIKAGKKAAVRSRALMPLARKLEGDNKYLALLSGTPIPNKVRDIAFTLKMLYPDKFADMPSAELVRDIIHGDAIDLRALLIPHMQMKELEDVVEMPERTEKIIEVKLSPAEADMYEALLELDELTATEKMQTLMRFLMNPALLDTTPGIEGAKVVALRNELQEIFKTKTKVLLLVNHFISGVLRGKHAILDKLDLPPNIKIETIHGEDDKKQRPKIQNQFNHKDDPLLLGGSGDAMGVGISLVGGQETVVYSEPWTESSLRQQKARVFRPGLKHAIRETTLIVSGTLDEGIHEYIARKHAVIEKILKGIPLSELDQRMAEKTETSADVEDIDFEVNPELARTYYSWKNRLTQMFGHTKENGEELMLKFLETWGEDYAEGYRQVGARSYQANTNRVAGTLIDEMIKKSGRHTAALQILDVASGPEMLRRHIGNSHRASIYSLDLNPHHFKDSTSGRTHTGSWRKMPFKARSFDYLNCAMAIQDSSFAPSKGKYERLDVLREMNRVLKPGGRVVISMIYSLQMSDMEKFKLFAEATGFRIVEDYSGKAEFGNQFSSQVITLEKFADVEKSSADIVKEVGFENVKGLKMSKTKVTVKNDREILTGFLLDGKAKIVDLNDSDRAVLREEKEFSDTVAEMKRAHGSIKDIPPQEIIDKRFVRILVSKRYYLFKRLTTAPGVAVLK